MKPRQHSYPDKKLEVLQRLTFDYFLKETNPENGLVRDSTREGSPCSIAPTGFALSAYPVGVERGFITRDDAIRRTLSDTAFLLEQPTWSATRCHRIQGLLLPLPRHDDRPTGVELRIINDRFDLLDRRSADRRGIFQSRHGRGGRDSLASRRDLSTRATGNGPRTGERQSRTAGHPKGVS